MEELPKASRKMESIPRAVNFNCYFESLISSPRTLPEVTILNLGPEQ
jgi:hypothetical protein